MLIGASGSLLSVLFPLGMSPSLSRRSALKTLAGGAALVTGGGAWKASAAEPAAGPLKGNINHSVCKWCYKASLEDLCKAAKDIGLKSVELLGPETWPTLKKYDLVCAMCAGPNVDGIGGIERAWNRVEHHEKLVEPTIVRIGEVAEAGYPNVICFSGNRAGMADEQGLENCALGLKRIMKAAEDRKVNVCMELLNSKVDHRDYMCDHTAWGVELCKRVGSERFKLLYDIYHMQIMEGDTIRTIQGDKAKNIEPAAPYIAHYHTGGNPGRHEIDETQETYYPAIMKAIKETGFKGYVAQEFIPVRDELTSLRQGVGICDV